VKIKLYKVYTIKYSQFTLTQFTTVYKISVTAIYEHRLKIKITQN